MYGVALDLGTSGFRAQLIDLEKKKTLRTVITIGHPLPGGNVMDHLDFAITTGEDVAHKVIVETVRKMFLKLDIDLSLCKSWQFVETQSNFLFPRIWKLGTLYTPEKTNRKGLESRM